MRRIFPLCILIGLTLPMLAGAADPTVLLERWQRLRDTDSAVISFKDGADFLADHRGWPDEKIIRIRTETAAFTERPDSAAVKPFCNDFPLISGRGMIACLRAEGGDADAKKTWLRKGWMQGDFNESEERIILAEYTSKLGAADHTQRIERLLYEQKATAAKRMMDLTPRAKHFLYRARIALIQKDSAIKKIMDTLSPADRRDYGLVFDRANAAADAKNLDTLVLLLKPVPASAPYPELWWPLRQLAVRELIADHYYSAALAILNNRGDLTGEALAEALWLKGWINLEYMHDAKNAYKNFYALYTSVATPVSKARAAYWAGRAATQNGNPEIAREWWRKGAKYPTVFYGQLSHLALTPNAPLPLPNQQEVSPGLKRDFERDEMVGVVRMIAATGDGKLVDRFLAAMASNTKDFTKAGLIAALAQELGGTASEVKVAKQALRNQIVLIHSGWPRIDLPETLGVEPALALAITRQESEFDPRARSGADARGLMQLLPSTARHVAEKNNIPYIDASLDNPPENITLGTAYLGQVIRGFDGSYILGIASYNAGPGSVRRWIGTMNTPPKTLGGALNWIESIPYGETRNYVMRVLENCQVYRTLADPKSVPALTEDLTR